MKVLVAGQAYYRRDNGQAVFTINLAEGLVAAGHQVTVLAPSDSISAHYTQIHGVHVQTVPALSLIDNTNVTAFSSGLVEEAITTFQPDIIHIQDHYFLSHAVLHVARTYGILAVGTNHFLPENLTDNLPFAKWIHKPLDYLLWQSMLSLYNQLQAVSTPTETAAAILRAHHIRVPVSAISCGVDLDRFCPRSAEVQMAVRQKYGISPNKTVFLYVGRLDREKDLDVLLHAWAEVKRDDIQLVLAGKGGFRTELEKLVGDLELANSVMFTGFVPDTDLPALLSSADIFAMPSHAELQSIATLEAMASGLPVLAANARALPEIVKSGVNGYLFTAGDVLDAAQKIRLLTDRPYDWTKMSNASKQRASLHAHDHSIEQYAEWYHETIAKQAVLNRWSAAFQAVDA